LAGNPNSGKTTLFNALTGLHQKVANYPGVTVEHQTGLWSVADCDFHITDLPGSYSLLPRSPDEAIASDWLSGCGKEPRPDAVICVADVTNLTRHLYLVGQIIDLGIPTVLALTMGDEAERIGLSVDTTKLAAHLKIPVVEVIAPQGRGLNELERAVRDVLGRSW
jgi:ferrous iron transport protein B